MKTVPKLVITCLVCILCCACAGCGNNFVGRWFGIHSENNKVVEIPLADPSELDDSPFGLKVAKPDPNDSSFPRYSSPTENLTDSPMRVRKGKKSWEY